MKRDRDFVWFAACVLGSIAGVFVLALFSGCAATPAEPEPLPHYPCKDAQGRVYQCDVWEWLEQQPKSRESKR